MALFVTDDIQVVAIDEVQFFSAEIIPTLMNLVDTGKACSLLVSI